MPVITSTLIITASTFLLLGAAVKVAFAWTRLPRLQLKAYRAFEKGEFSKAAELAEEAYNLSLQIRVSDAARRSAEEQYNAYRLAACGQYGSVGGGRH